MQYRLCTGPFLGWLVCVVLTSVRVGYSVAISYPRL